MSGARLVAVVLRPAGSLHLGNARKLLLAWLAARAEGAVSCLWLDDTAAPAPEVENAILADLAWLGVRFDRVVRASTCAEAALAALSLLRQAERVYPCWESEAELAARRRWRIRRGLNPAYDRTMLKLSPERRAELARTSPPYLRGRLSDGVAAWRDTLRGLKPVPLSRLDDPVLQAADGTPTALLALAAWLAEARPALLVAAEDRVEETAALVDLLGVLAPHLPLPGAAHLPLVAGLDAASLRSLTLHRLRADGMQPEAIAAWAAGAAEPAPPQALAEHFRLPLVKGGRFRMAGLLALNREALAALPFASAAARLPAGASEAFWLAIRGHVDLLEEAAVWWRVVSGRIAVAPLGDARLAQAAQALAQGWHAMAEIAPESALRLALTGEETGPPMETLLPLIGGDRAFSRLMAAAGVAAPATGDA